MHIRDWLFRARFINEEMKLLHILILSKKDELNIPLFGNLSKNSVVMEDSLYD